MDREQAIEAARDALSGGEDDFGVDDVSVQHGDGHSGVGWYASYAEYPEEGSIFLGGA